MPSRFIVRKFVAGGYYHLYNKTSKESLFKDDQDYRVFLFYLYIYSTPKEAVSGKYPDLPTRLVNHNLYEELKVIAYCLMPDHFHLLLQQTTNNAIPNLLKQIKNGYTAYYHQKYQEEGPVFKGRYKSVKTEDDNQVVQLWRYIHLNPVTSGMCGHPVEYEWSSYKLFMGQEDDIKINDELVRGAFKTSQEIEEFHTNKEGYERDLPLIKDLVIEKV